MVDVYHEVSWPAEVLASVKRALKEGGKLVLVEYRLEDPEVPIKPVHKMTRAQMDREMKAGGFKVAGSFDELPWQHMVFYEVE
jgi:predicted methyltransferase